MYTKSALLSILTLSLFSVTAFAESPRAPAEGSIVSSRIVAARTRGKAVRHAERLRVVALRLVTKGTAEK